MKNLYNVFFILFVTSLISCGNKVSVDELTIRGGIVQYKGKPYNGSAFESYPNGDIKSEGRFADGIKVGRIVEYYENKQISSEEYYIIDKNSKGIPTSYADGEHKYFYETGKLRYVERYRRGLQDGLEEHFSETGFKFTSTNYKDGQKEGMDIQYQYEGLEGVLKFKCNYRYGKPDGEMLSYFNDGTLSDKSFFINGKKDGVHERYNPKGDLIERNVYKLGVKIESESFGNGEYIPAPMYLPAKKG